jgi:SAM-dependent methyltransferase
MLTCPLCRNIDNHAPVKGADARQYFHCSNCDLIFVAPAFYLSAEAEQARYQFHQNNIEDVGYVAFLNKAIQPALLFMNSAMKGLDYGCGPSPTLSKLLQQQGFLCDDYDPYFFPELNTTRKYDFIFATECFEHFFQPEKELHIISDLLNENGLLIIMTEQWQTIEHFNTWYYPKDPTHVCFYHTNTFNFIAEKFGFEILHNDEKRVVVLRKINGF